MIDEDLDALIAAAASITDDQLAEISTSKEAIEFRESIMRVSTRTGTESPIIVARRRWWRAPALVAIAVNALLLVVAGVAVWYATSVGSGSAWGAPILDFARSSPLLLVDEHGWVVTRADERSDGEGEMTFSNGGDLANLHWRAGSYQDWFADRAAGALMIKQRTVLGRPAHIVQHDQGNDFTALWPDLDKTIEFRMTTTDLVRFEQLVDSLTQVDIETWLSAMPPSVIQAFQRSSTVDEILSGVALPAGFDPSAIKADTKISDRYQLGAQVVSQVVCAWIRQWVTATRDGDQPAAQRAVDALAGSRNWPILQAMSTEGGLPRVVWRYADGLAAGGILRGETRVEDDYKHSFGCK